ncbi:hypothetical protein BDR26DRAFT_1006610 [Obelidium mucronatum]|nr:hypothetical protein BDR26DRAFT_1006610 [Obelidium mucronatum]
MAPLTLRAKRLKATYFVSAESNDSVLALKGKLAHMIGKKEAKDLRLQILDQRDKTKPGVLATLEDPALLEQLGLTDDAVVYFSYWLGEGQDGSWEPVQFIEFEPLNDEGEGHA